MRTGLSTLIAILIILSGVGCGFLYQYRVESDERVGKAFPAITADEMRHDLYDGVLQKHVDSQGRVNYAALKSNSQALESYLDLLAAASPEDLPTPQARLAFWINAYNALTIKGVIAHYPTRNVRKIKPLGGFFRRIKFQVGRQSYTLHDIEHGIIRSEFYHEPRIHFALVCASTGCPILENRAFFPETLEERLENATFNFISNQKKCV